MRTGRRIKAGSTDSRSELALPPGRSISNDCRCAKHRRQTPTSRRERTSWAGAPSCGLVSRPGHSLARPKVSRFNSNRSPWFLETCGRIGGAVGRPHHNKRRDQSDLRTSVDATRDPASATVCRATRSRGESLPSEPFDARNRWSRQANSRVSTPQSQVTRSAQPITMNRLVGKQREWPRSLDTRPSPASSAGVRYRR